MSLFTESSLCLVPSGVKDGKCYSIKPTDGSGDLTFSRGSDIEATRVASNGYIEKAKVNLLYHSNNFTFTWTNTRSGEVSGYAGYDGTNNAWALIGTAIDSTHLIVQNVTLTASVVTFSVYVKAGAKDYCILRLDDGTPDYAYFDLSTGTKGTISVDYIDSTITSVGSGWYRVSVTKVATAGTNVAVIYPAEFDNDPTYLGDGVTEDLYMQNSQINYGLVPQEYVDSPSASSVVSGITNDLPRLDYSGGASCPSLLLEPSRTNAVPHSEYLNGITSAGGTITDNATTSLEGVVNAGLFTENTSNTYHRFNTGNQSYTQNQAYTFSVFVKADSGNRYVIVNCVSAFNARAYFDIDNGTFTTNSGTASIEEYSNGWYRCIVTGTRTAATGTDSIYFGLNATEADSAYTGDGTSGAYFWGAQLEAGSYPTSYIPCYGTSATRTAESCSKTGISSLIGQTEGTLFLEVDAVNFETDQRFAISDGTSANRIALRMSTGGVIQLSVVIGSTTQASVSGSGSVGNTYKIAGAYKANDFVLYINGTLAGTDTSGSVSGTFSRLATDNGVSGQDFYNPIKQALLFPTRLSNADLATLTA